MDSQHSAETSQSLTDSVSNAIELKGYGRFLALLQWLRRCVNVADIPWAEVQNTIHCRKNAIPSAIEIICQDIRRLVTFLCRQHKKHRAAPKCDEWDCISLIYGGIFTEGELIQFGRSSGCEHFKDHKFTNMQIVRRGLTNAAASCLSSSAVAIYLAKTNKEIADLCDILPGNILNGPLNIAGRELKLSKLYILEPGWYSKCVSSILGTHRGVGFVRGDFVKTIDYKAEHDKLFAHARQNLKAIAEVNPWMTSVEFASYAVLRAFAPLSSIGQLSPADGYREVCRYFANGTVHELFNCDIPAPLVHDSDEASSDEWDSNSEDSEDDSSDEDDGAGEDDGARGEKACAAVDGDSEDDEDYRPPQKSKRGARLAERYIMDINTEKAKRAKLILDAENAKLADIKLRELFGDIVYGRKPLTAELNSEIETLKFIAYKL